jgi:hypothetical protein
VTPHPRAPDAPLSEIVAYYGTQDEPQFSMPFNFFLVMNASEYIPSSIASAVTTYSEAVPTWGWTNYVMSATPRDFEPVQRP